VHDYKRQLSEALRVSQPGSKMGFSVWGLRQNILIYPLVEEILERHGLGPQTKPAKTNYDIANNSEEIKREMLAMGFINIKMWFQPMNFIFQTFEEFFKTMFGQPTTATKL
jgi:hypothetical protein